MLYPFILTNPNIFENNCNLL